MCMSSPKIPPVPKVPAVPKEEDAAVVARRDDAYRRKQAAMYGFRSTILGSRPTGSQTLGG